MIMDEIPKTLSVKVTQEHIDKGQPGQSQKCPIALAIKEKYGDKPTVAGSVIISFGKTMALYISSTRAVSFIAAFDSAGKVEPSEFRFKLSQWRSRKEHAWHPASELMN